MPVPLPDASRDVVLIVDDDAAARLLARAALEQAGFAVIEADDGTSAVPLFRERKPDVVILDVIMREMDGFEACTQIRRLPGGDYVPILMMTALDDLGSINRAFESGATDFHPKGINHALLAYRVRYLLRAKHVADALRSSESRLENAQRVARLGHWEWDSDTGQAYYSESLKSILGWKDDQEVRDKSYESLIARVHPDDRATVSEQISAAAHRVEPFRLQHRVLDADGKERVVYHEGEVTRQGRRIAIVGTVQDVTERIQVEQRLDYLTYYDELTNLPNRSFLREHIRRTLLSASPGKAVISVLVLDLDQFKLINDTLGHTVGDGLLIAVAERLRRCVGTVDRLGAEPSDTSRIGLGNIAARLGGDEFGVLLARTGGSHDDTVERIKTAMSEPFRVADRELHVTTSVGISTYPKDGESAEALLKNADAAMYRAKELGRDRHEFYTGSINVRAARRFILENDLRKALAQSQLRLHYQPKIALRDDQPIGAEALIRWEHPNFGMVPPDEFIPLAEESGLIQLIGEWVLRTACMQVRKWHDAGYQLELAVNVSGRQFKEKDFAATVRSILAETSFTPYRLELELTEGVLMENAAISTSVLGKLRDVGLKIALDDFGTGYSSLSYLQRFPIDTLKVDKSFVKEIADDIDSATLVKTIIAMAQSLRLKVVAEGVETDDQLEFLKRHNCDIVQGYLISRPLPAEDFERWLASARPTIAERASG